MIITAFYKYNDVPDGNLFVDKIPVFATQNYADYLREIRNRDTVWIAQLDNNKVSYLIPIAINKRLIFRRGYFLTAVISFNPENSPEDEKKFLDSVIIYLKKNKICDWVQQGPNWALFNTSPSGSTAVKFGTYRIYLKEKNEAELYYSIKKKCRFDINKAKKSEVEIKKGFDYLNDCLEIINATSKKAGLHVLSSYEAGKLVYHFKDNLKIYVSFYNDIPQSAAILLCNSYCTYAMYAGKEARAFPGSNKYLFWEAIKDAKYNNSEYFDFVGGRINPAPGSKLESIQKFKENFGSDFVRGCIWKTVISERKFKAYNTLINFYFRITNKKNKKDIIDQELEVQKNEDINSDN